VRLFFAVVPPAAVLDDLAAAVQALPGKDEHGLRWVPPARMHLTLAFLGDVAEDALPSLLERSGPRCGPPRADDAAGPRRRQVRRAGPVGGHRGRRRPPGCAGASVQAAARRAGCAVDERRFRAHLTGRPGPASGRPRGLAAALRPYAGPAWTAPTVALVRSRLGPDPRYDTVEEWASAPAASLHRVDPRTRRWLVPAALLLLVLLVAAGALLG
jgi:2'-5' RNA ligase